MAITQCKICQAKGEFSLLLPVDPGGKIRERDMKYACDNCGFIKEPSGEPLDLEKLIKSYGKEK